MSSLAPTTELAILLTARWAVNGAKPLTNGEFGEVVRALGPGQEGAQQLLHGGAIPADITLDSERIGGLLGRGLGVFQAIDRWERAGLWVVSWTDPGYPERFKQLRQKAPALLFGCGNPKASSPKALAIFGSRKADEQRLAVALEIGAACSEAGVTVVSGGARGIDASAMVGGIQRRGTVVGVLPDSLLRESGRKAYREAFEEGRLCLMSEVHPEARFEVGNAMARNRLAYACADAALVIECEAQRGGTWAGAIDALKQGKAVYVLHGASAERELVEHGAVAIDVDSALRPLRLVESGIAEGSSVKPRGRRTKADGPSLFDFE